MILCIDGDPATRAVIERVLREHGLRCRATASDEAATRLASSAPPRLLILERQRAALLPRLRQHAPEAAVLWIEPGDAREATMVFTAPGQPRGIRRPIEPRALLAAVRQVVGSGRQTSRRLQAPAPVQRAAEDPSAVYERYIVQEVVASGRLGRAVVAWDDDAGKLVALSLWRIAALEEAIERGPERVEQAARAARGLDHPAIPRVRDVARERGELLIAFDRVVGDPAEGRYDPMRAARLLAPAARAVDAAHQYGIVHGALQPARVLFGPSQRTWVTGFGASPWLGLDGPRATPAPYLAPELPPGGASSAGDIYAMGAVLRGMLGLQDDTLPLAVPPGLVRLSQRATAADPAERLPSAAALAEELERFAVQVSLEDTAKVPRLKVDREPEEGEEGSG